MSSFTDNDQSIFTDNDDNLNENEDGVSSTNNQDIQVHQQKYHEHRDFILPPLACSIKILYALNGLIEVVPNLALTSLINDRIQMPLEYLPSYYAIEFLPYSFKPLYAILTYWVTKTTISIERSQTNGNQVNDFNGSLGGGTDYRIQRYYLMVILQICASICLVTTAFLPPKVLSPCYILGFLRSVMISWAEFLNGLALISSAKSTSKDYDGHNSLGQPQEYLFSTRNYEEKLLSLHQSQAAMSRNVGGLLGQIFIFIVIGGRNRSRDSETKDTSLSDQFVTMTLLGSAFIPLTAAIVAFNGRVGSHLVESTRTNRGRSAYGRVERDQSSIGVSPIINTDKNLHITRVAIYLVLRHAVPSAGSLTWSFIYNVLRKMPQYLQLKALLASITAVFSSWVYGRFVSKEYSNIQELSRFIIITTMITALISLMFIPFYMNFRTSLLFNNDQDIHAGDGSQNDNIGFQGSMAILVLFTLFQLVESFFTGITFLPSVILATNTVAHTSNEGHFVVNQDDNDDERHDDSSNNQETQHGEICHILHQEESSHHHNAASQQNFLLDCPKLLMQRLLADDGILYGLMIAFIDLGDFFGSWLAAPLVKAFGIERSNNWENLSWYIIFCSSLSLLSLGFLRILWHSSKPVDR